MFSVLDKHLLADMGKTIVRKYVHTTDVQSVWKDFPEQMKSVEKSVFSIWVDLFLCRSIQLLVLSYAEMSVYMYLSQLMSTFTNYHKGASSSRWYLLSMTRRTSDPTITHIYLYTRVPQI